MIKETVTLYKGENYTQVVYDNGKYTINQDMLELKHLSSLYTLIGEILSENGIEVKGVEKVPTDHEKQLKETAPVISMFAITETI